jgi:structure-specific endonuclease subunit SLX1
MKKAKSLFYACYLLLSLSPMSKNNVYVGSTPNPVRRLRQHNGEITGGAKKTLSKRPWQMVVVVYGFPSRLAALQFEWAWQNPHKSRHFKSGQFPSTFIGKQKERYLAGKLQALNLMFHLDQYKRWPLHIHFTNSSVQKMFEQMLDLPPHVGVTTGTLETIPCDQNAKTIEGAQSLLCIICKEKIDIEEMQNLLACTSDSCAMLSHLICLSSHFLTEENKTLSVPNIIPLQGSCPVCAKDLKWGDLINGMKCRLGSVAVGKTTTVTTPGPSIITISDDSDSDSQYDVFHSLPPSPVPGSCTSASGSDTDQFEHIMPAPVIRRRQKYSPKSLQAFVISSDTEESLTKTLSNILLHP